MALCTILSVSVLLWTTVRSFIHSKHFRSSYAFPKKWVGQGYNYPIQRMDIGMGLLDDFKKIVGAATPTELLGQENSKQLKIYMQTVDKINLLEKDIEKLSNDELRAKTNEFRSRLRRGASLDSLLIEAFAVAREASWRVLKLRHFDVQLVGGMALHDGRLAEMATGEGKTLVGVLALYLNALPETCSFIVTTNDYLARRDGETMGQVFRFLGLSVGIVQAYQKEAERKAAYGADITYVSNQELGFDFLRDNLALSMENIVQTRPFNFCLVDEADSIMIDEARTPLIISRKGSAPTQKYVSASQIASNLVLGQHYEVNEKEVKIDLTPAGFRFAEKIVGKSLFDLADPWAFYIVSALKAKELYAKDKEYIVENGQVFIVDEFTGRVLEGRRFTDGLQQAIEAKEGLTVSGETQVVAKVTYQNLFRLFPKLAGMTGTAATESAELQEVYQLKVFPVPTALPVARRDNTDAVFRTQDGKMKALLKNVLVTHEKGRPILIGTTSVDSSEEIASALKDLGVQTKVLNAKPENVERESEIVAQAGRLGAVTVATNMAGRGTDIVLGGSARGTAKVLAKYLLLARLGELVVPAETTAAATTVSAEQEEGGEEEETDPDVLALPDVAALALHLELWLPTTLSRRAELDLKRAVVSCSDVLADGAGKGPKGRVIVEDFVTRAGDSAPLSTADMAEDTVMALKFLRSALNTVSSEFDEAIMTEREAVKNLGGLYVVGTARHESRRIDNQLRGRSGRQGDPGSTRFFLSLEDNLFKVFGADKIGDLMANFRVAEDMPIESDMVVQALDKVQLQVEDFYRANRQKVFKLDEVAATQRAVVYSQRRAFMSSTDLGMTETFDRYAQETLTEIHNAAVKAGGGAGFDPEKLLAKTLQFFPTMQITAEELAAVSPVAPGKALPLLQAKLKDAIAAKKAQIDSVGNAWAFPGFCRYLTMVQIDECWCKHLSRLDLLKEEMVLQSFTAEKDVMDSYKERAMTLFDSLLDDVRRNTVYSLFAYKATSA